MKKTTKPTKNHGNDNATATDKKRETDRLNDIELNRYKGDKHNELFLKTFKASDIDNGTINGDTLIYFGKKIACIVARANYQRGTGCKYVDNSNITLITEKELTEKYDTKAAEYVITELNNGYVANKGNDFNRRLYVSVCGYDYHNGTQRFYNIGGEDLISESIKGLAIAKNLGAKTLNDVVEYHGKEHTAFKLACKFVNAYIYQNKRFMTATIPLDNVLKLEGIGQFFGEFETDIEKNILIDTILQNIKISEKMIDYMDMVKEGYSVRQVADKCKKHHSTVQEAFRSIRKKMIVYCLENDIDFGQFESLKKIFSDIENDTEN